MKHLREYIRRVISEVDVLSPENDPRQQQQFPGGLKPNKIGPSTSYKPKEDVRGQLQKLISQKVKTGTFTKDDDVKNYLDNEDAVRKDGKFADEDDVKLASTALKMVPLSVWKQLP